MAFVGAGLGFLIARPPTRTGGTAGNSKPPKSKAGSQNRTGECSLAREGRLVAGKWGTQFQASEPPPNHFQW